MPALHPSGASRNEGAIAEGRVRLVVGDAEAPPALGGPFDKIFGVNVWMFWREPLRTVRHLRSLLAPGGTLALTYLPRHKNASSADTRSGAERLVQLLIDAELEHVTARFLPMKPIDAVCVLGHAALDVACGGHATQASESSTH